MDLLQNEGVLGDTLSGKPGVPTTSQDKAVSSDKVIIHDKVSVIIRLSVVTVIRLSAMIKHLYIPI